MCLLSFRLAAFAALFILLLEAVGHLLSNIAVFFEVDVGVGPIENHGTLELRIEGVMKILLPLLPCELGKVRKSDELGSVGSEVTERFHGKLHQLVLCLETTMGVIEAFAEEFN